MRPLLKSLLLWLLALALPVQALAAAGMQHCGASHERMRAAAAAYPHAHEEAAGGAHEHHHAAAPAAEVADDHAGPGAGSAGFSCSACAACCIALALPAADVRSAAPPPDAYASALPAVQVPPFVTGGLDRPPRGALA